MRLRAVLASILVPALLTACYEQVAGPGEETDGRVTVINDSSALAERIEYTDEDVPIDPPDPQAFAAAPGMHAISPPALAPSQVNLRLIAEVDPPTIDGVPLQATSISARSSLAFLVSYNVRGATFLGGVDYIINWFGRRPRVLSAAYFADSDVSAVGLNGSAVYAATATDDANFSTSAALDVLGLSFFGLRILSQGRVDLSSFAATSALAVGQVIYVTTGDGGDLYALDANDLSVLAQSPLDDARWVAHDEDNGRIVVVQGTPGRIAVFEEGNFSGGSLNLLATHPFDGADIAESKSTVEVVGGKAFIAAGSEGVQIMCLDDGSIVGSVPRPDPASLGLDPSVVVTNAVSVEGDLMFISNGEAGVYVAAGDEAFDQTSCSEPQSVGVLGQLQFGALESVNHVDYRSGVLLVAAGLGGLKIVTVGIIP